jgi:hypothetical protein
LLQQSFLNQDTFLNQDKSVLLINLSKGDSDQLRFKESTSQYSKWLSNFEFLLELAWLGEKCKGKTLLVIEIFLYSAQILHCHIPVLVLSIQSKI